MELKVSSPKPRLSPPDDVSNPEEKEISDDEDDDRNHKHRRRDGRSESMERDALEPVHPRPYRKRNKPYENGNYHKEGDSQSSENWKNYGGYNKRRPGISSFSHDSLDSTQGPGRGRGREGGFGGQRGSRFGSAGAASQLIHQGAMPSNLFAGRGVPHNAHSANWSTFGMVPALPNRGLDTLHPVHLQGPLRQPINPVMNMGIPLQRCRDFEERGFCLRGDMCPMEHGVNRIVVEDVQSLSQFNLPVSLPSAHLLGPPPGQGPLPAVSMTSSTLSKNLGSRNSKPGTNGDGMGLNDVLADDSVTAGADIYDPDQPLWANGGPETSAALLSLNSSTLDEPDSSLDMVPSDRCHFGLSDGFDNTRIGKNAEAAGRSQSSSVWGRIGSSKNRSEKEKVDPILRSSTHSENEVKADQESLTCALGSARQGKHMNANAIGQQVMGTSLRPKVDSGRSLRKPSQKALRTLFVNGVPQKDNKRETLLSHFQKFGEVIDIYIPLNSERAFIQFSKREEAEAALEAPDAVLGNRFIKLWWANRDNIPDDGIIGGSNVSMPSGGMTSVLPQSSVAGKVKDISHSAASKNYISHSYIATGPAYGHPKPLVVDGPKAPPPSQKKLENLELLKEEIRKKQEMLDQKRNEFRQQLEKLAKQGNGPKDEQASDPAVKRHKAGAVVASAKSETSKATGPGAVAASLPQDEGTTGNSKSLENIELQGPKSSSGAVAASLPQGEGTAGNSRSLENIVLQGPKLSSNVAMLESMSLKPSIRPLAPVGAPFIINRFKLDNRPTTFKIIPPLPGGLANVAVLKEHFASYGDLSTVELEKLEEDGNNESETSYAARICFTTRRAAERAFLGGKCWQGHNLQFMWLTPRSSGKDIVRKENPSACIQAPPDTASTVSERKADSGNVESGDPENRNADSGNIESGGLENRNADSGNVESGDPEKNSDFENVESADPEKRDVHMNNVDSENLGSSSDSVSSAKLSS